MAAPITGLGRMVSHPVHFEHINPFGYYRFDTQRGPAKGRLRPLRPAAYTARQTPATNATATNA